MTNSPSVYADIELSTELMSASSHRIIQLLFEKFLQHMQTAIRAIHDDDRNARNISINKANDIVTHLRGCLKFEEETKAFSEQLDSTYVIIQKCLLNATLKNDPEYLNLASLMMSNIKSGWDQIG